MEYQRQNLNELKTILSNWPVDSQGRPMAGKKMAEFALFMLTLEIEVINDAGVSAGS